MCKIIITISPEVFKSVMITLCEETISWFTKPVFSVTFTLKSKEMRIQEENVLSWDENSVTVQANWLYFLYANIISIDFRVKYELLSWDWHVNVVL